MKLPRALSEVGHDFLTTALQRRWPGLKVTSARFADHTEGTSSRARLLLTYGNIPDGVDPPPPSMWLKSSFNDLHDVILRFDPFRIEARFYQMKNVPVATPDCYFAEFDEERHALLLLEDLAVAGVRFGHVSRPVALESAKAVLSQLARMHAGTWSMTEAYRPAWLETPLTGGYSKFFQTELMERLPKLWRGRRADLVPQEFQDTDRVRACFSALQQRNSLGKGCLLHGDCHAGNVYYGPMVNEAGVLDWSLLRWGSWAHDVGYYVQSALSVAERREWEVELIDHYIGELEHQGGPRLERREAWDAYAVQPLYGFLTWMATFPEMQGEETCRTTVARFATAATDLKTLERLA